MDVLGMPLQTWVNKTPVIADLINLRETAWFNPARAHTHTALADVGLTPADIDDAATRLQRFAPYLAAAFPALEATNGIIESPITPAPQLQKTLNHTYQTPLPGQLWLKRDDCLPVSGSIKARGGIHEVLQHAEHLAHTAGLLDYSCDYRILATPPARDLFSQHTIAVGSTGNLGLSIGIMAATLGFNTIVHMSADARQWKKDLLAAQGVDVREYEADYSVAVAAGRAEAANDPFAHFIDDENSTKLFCGYAVAGRRVAAQLRAANVRVDTEHPLFVYLPCGVGGGPGGVAFGLLTEFGDAVHPIFAEPTHSPCMLLGVATGQHDAICVGDFGIDNRTAADGLAVGRPSGFVGRAMQRLLDGFYTVEDNHLFTLLTLLHETENIAAEPSAAASLPGPWHVATATEYRERLGITDTHMNNATHLAWLTGGSMVPPEIMNTYLSHSRSPQ
ncbi:D-serine ammonia-lyase [Dermatophilus congolensis]|nr:D-serine ammonia-lyase [Dermatophilus congolensis]